MSLQKLNANDLIGTLLMGKNDVYVSSNKTGDILEGRVRYNIQKCHSTIPTEDFGAESLTSTDVATSPVARDTAQATTSQSHGTDLNALQLQRGELEGQRHSAAVRGDYEQAAKINFQIMTLDRQIAEIPRQPADQALHGQRAILNNAPP